MRNWVFNFSISSVPGGGFSRLVAFLDFFESKGGAYFIVSGRAHELLRHKYAKNQLIPLTQSRISRLFGERKKIREICNGIPGVDVFFSFGVPVYEKYGKLNWYHVSNVLMLSSSGIAGRLKRRLEMVLLKFLTVSNFNNVNIISGESAFTIKYLKEKVAPEKIAHIRNYYVLENGLEGFPETGRAPFAGKVKYALVIGTQPYRRAPDAVRIFRLFQAKFAVERLIVIGPVGFIPRNLLKLPDVFFLDRVKRSNTLRLLRHTALYISASQIENSSVADIEGIHFSANCILSDIESRAEIMQSVHHTVISPGNGLNFPCLLVEKQAARYIKPWPLLAGLFFDFADSELLKRSQANDAKLAGAVP